MEHPSLKKYLRLSVVKAERLHWHLVGIPWVDWRLSESWAEQTVPEEWRERPVLAPRRDGEGSKWWGLWLGSLTSLPSLPSFLLPPPGLLSSPGSLGCLWNWWILYIVFLASFKLHWSSVWGDPCSPSPITQKQVGSHSASFCLSAHFFCWYL